MPGSADSTLRFDHWGTDVADPPRHAPGPPPQAPRRPVRLRLLVLALVVAAAAAVVVHVVGGSSPPPGARLSAASQREIAAAINLTAADLPGFNLQGSSSVTVGGNPNGQFKNCFGSSLPNDPGSADFGSPGFDEHGSYGYVGVGSDVSFVSAAQLTRDAAVARAARFPQCFARAFAAMSFRAHGVTVTGSNPQVQTLPIASPTASGVLPVLAMRATLTWTIRGIALPVHFDLFLFGVGHDELSLYALALGQPYSTAAESQLVSALVARALAEPH